MGFKHYGNNAPAEDKPRFTSRYKDGDVLQAIVTAVEYFAAAEFDGRPVPDKLRLTFRDVSEPYGTVRRAFDEDKIESVVHAIYGRPTSFDFHDIDCARAVFLGRRVRVKVREYSGNTFAGYVDPSDPNTAEQSAAVDRFMAEGLEEALGQAASNARDALCVHIQNGMSPDGLADWPYDLIAETTGITFTGARDLPSQGEPRVEGVDDDVPF